MKQFEVRYNALEERKREGLDELINSAISVCENETGTVVMMTDVDGSGLADCICLGNALLIEPLLLAGAEVALKTFARHGGTLQ